MRIPAILFAIPLLLLSGCYFDKAEMLNPMKNCDLSDVTYKKTVVPILTQNCNLSSCHSSSGSSIINLNDFSEVAGVAKDGRLLGSMRHEAGFDPMPRVGPKLDSCTIEKIAGWVAAGALNN